MLLEKRQAVGTASTPKSGRHGGRRACPRDAPLGAEPSGTVHEAAHCASAGCGFPDLLSLSDTRQARPGPRVLRAWKAKDSSPLSASAKSNRGPQPHAPGWTVSEDCCPILLRVSLTTRWVSFNCPFSLLQTSVIPEVPLWACGGRML